LAALRVWIAARDQQNPLPALPHVDSEAIRTLLSGIKKAGNYVLQCKVNNALCFSDVTWLTEIL
jgi:hypothetical protein